MNFSIGNRIVRREDKCEFVVTGVGIAARTFFVTDLGPWRRLGYEDRLASFSSLREGDILLHRHPYRHRKAFVVMPYDESVLLVEVVEYGNPLYWDLIETTKEEDKKDEQLSLWGKS